MARSGRTVGVVAAVILVVTATVAWASTKPSAGELRRLETETAAWARERDERAAERARLLQHQAIVLEALEEERRLTAVATSRLQNLDMDRSRLAELRSLLVARLAAMEERTNRARATLRRHVMHEREALALVPFAEGLDAVLVSELDRTTASADLDRGTRALVDYLAGARNRATTARVMPCSASRPEPGDTVEVGVAIGRTVAARLRLDGSSAEVALPIAGGILWYPVDDAGSLAELRRAVLVVEGRGTPRLISWPLMVVPESDGPSAVLVPPEPVREAAAP